MREAILNVNIPGSWVGEIAQKYDAKVHVLGSMTVNEEDERDLVEIVSENVDAILEDINNNPRLLDPDFDKLESNKIVGAVTVKSCLGCHLIASSNCFLLAGKGIGDGSVEWRLFLSSGEHLQDLINRLEKANCKVTLKKISSVNMDELLTEREEEITFIAYKKGYFDYPKKVGIRELAQDFEISPSTLSESLRRGQRKIMAKYFEAMAHSHKGWH